MPRLQPQTFARSRRSLPARPAVGCRIEALEARRLLSALPAPTLTATPAANDTDIVLTWTSTATQATGFEIDRSSDGVNYTAVATVAAGVSTYTDTGLAAGTPYDYEAVALDGAARSPASAAISVTTTNFQLFDATLFLNKPNLSQYGMTEGIYIAYTGYVEAADGLPDEAKTRAQADAAVAANDKIFVLDEEDWNIDPRSATPAQLTQYLGYFSEVIGWVRSEQPSLKIGLFADLPVYNGIDAAATAANQQLMTFAQQVDYLFPELYTESTDPTQWTSVAVGVLQEARMFGKPVYPFLWDDYGPFAPFSGLPVPQAYWQEELAIVRRYANGAVIWDGDYVDNWNPTAATAPWWQTTLQFLSTPDPSTPPLSAPVNVTATGNLGEITLNWTNTSSGGDDGITIERSTDNTHFYPLAMLPPGTTSYRDTALYGGPYYYQICDSTWLTDSAPSAVASATELQTATATFQAVNYNQEDGSTYSAPYIPLGQGNSYEYSGVDFGSGVNTFTAVLATAGNISMQLHLDGLTGPVVGNFTLSAFGQQEQTYLPMATSIASVSGVHDLYFTAIGSGGVEIQSFSFCQGTRPAAPTSLMVTQTGDNPPTLQWQDNTGDASGFTIERSVDGVNFTQIAQVAAGILSYTDTNDYGGSTYTYRVSAFSLTGGTSTGYSNLASCTPLRNPLALLSVVEPDADGGIGSVSGGYAGGLANGSWFAYNNVNFGSGVTTFSADIALPSTYAGQTIQVHLDSLNGPVVTTLTEVPTSGWYSFNVQSTPVASVTGIHNIYIVFSSPTNVQGFQFSIAPAWLNPTSAALWNQSTQTLTVNGNASIIGNPGTFGDVPIIDDQAGSNLTVQTQVTGGGDGAPVVDAATISGNGSTTVSGNNSLVVGNFSQAALVNNGIVTLNGSGTLGTLSDTSGSGINGTTTVSSTGNLTVTNTFAQANLVNNGAVYLDGNGTIGELSGTGRVTIGNGGSSSTVMLAAQAAPGILSGLRDTQASVTVNSGSTLDITNNVLLLNYGSGSSPLAAVANAVAWGSGNSGNGSHGSIISSTINTATANTAGKYAVGYADHTEVGSLPTGNVEVAYTLTGDANLDGAVDILDYQAMAVHYDEPGIYDWSQGDFMHHGQVDILAYQAMSPNYDTNLAAELATAAAAQPLSLATATASNIPPNNSAGNATSAALVNNSTATGGDTAILDALAGTGNQAIGNSTTG